MDPLVAAMKQRSDMSEGSILPSPFNLRNPQVLRDPQMWILYFASLKVNINHFVDSFGLPGLVAQAFRRGLEASFVRVSITESELRELEDLFRTLDFLYAQACKPARVETLDNLMLIIDAPLRNARERLTALIRREIESEVSNGAGEHCFAAVSILDPANFPCGQAELVKRIPKAQAEKSARDDSGQPAAQKKKKKPRPDRDDRTPTKKLPTCRRCKKEVQGSPCFLCFTLSCPLPPKNTNWERM